LAKKPEGVIARTQWHPVKPTMLRHCLKCGKQFPSTSPYDRRCVECIRQEQSSRARAAITANNREVIDYIESLFDHSIFRKADLARKFDSRRRARVNLAALRRRGLGESAEAADLARLLARPDVYIRKEDVDVGEEASREAVAEDGDGGPGRDAVKPGGGRRAGGALAGRGVDRPAGRLARPAGGGDAGGPEGRGHGDSGNAVVFPPGRLGGAAAAAAGAHGPAAGWQC
jgi:hypothetical protein